MLTSVRFRCGDEIDQREAGVNILKMHWKEFAPKDTQRWGQRIANSGGYIVAAYVGDVIAGILEGMRLNLGGTPSKIPTTFRELTADGTWSNHQQSGDTVVLVDLTIAPEYRGTGLFEVFLSLARKTFQSPSGRILTYSPLFQTEDRYSVVRRHEQFGGKLASELPRSRPGLTMPVGGHELLAEDVGVAVYTL
jgi:hypothetical protein